VIHIRVGDSIAEEEVDEEEALNLGEEEIVEEDRIRMWRNVTWKRQCVN
jgi:hypothetical protein